MNTKVNVPDKMRENKLKYLSVNCTIIKVELHRTMRNGMLMTYIRFTNPSEQFYKYLEAYAPVKDIKVFQDTMFLNQEQYDFIKGYVANGVSV